MAEQVSNENQMEFSNNDQSSNLNEFRVTQKSNIVHRIFYFFIEGNG